MRMTASVKGYNELKAKMSNAPELYGFAWGNALRRAANIILQELRYRVPYATGRLSGSLKATMSKSQIPKWAKVEMGNVTAKGLKSGTPFRYGGALHGGPMYHYRSGPFRGYQTKGWFTKVIPDVESRVEGLLQDAAREIMSKWGKV